MPFCLYNFINGKISHQDIDLEALTVLNNCYGRATKVGISFLLMLFGIFSGMA